MKSVEQMLADHPFLAGFTADHIESLACGAAEIHFEADDYIFHEREDATRFYLIVEGSVALKIHVPHAGPIPIQTISAGQVLGWSWLIQPYKWHFDARAFTPVRAVALDAAYLRRLFDDNPGIGYQFLLRIAHILAERLQAARLQLLDVYQAAT